MAVTPIPPSSLTGTPVFRGWLPSGIYNAGQTSTEQGENPWGLADASVANGYVTRWSAMAGSAASSELGNGFLTGSGLVLDHTGGLGLCGHNMLDGSTQGGIYSSWPGNLPNGQNFTMVFVGSCCGSNVLSNAYHTQTSSTMKCCMFFGFVANYVQLGIDGYHRWSLLTAGAQFGSHFYNSSFKKTSSTQVIIVRGTASSLDLQVYANGALSAKASFAALASGTMDGCGMGWQNNPGAGGWIGPIRAGLCINSAVSDAQAPGLCEWALQQAGLGMGTTTETNAASLIGDSIFASGFGYGNGNIAAFLAESLAGKVAIDTVARGGASAAAWDSSSPNMIADLAALSGRFPGMTIDKHYFITLLGVNDAAIGGGTGIATAPFIASYKSVVNKLEAISPTFVCTIPPSANDGGGSWTAGSNADKNNSGGSFNPATSGILAYNAAIRSNFDASKIIDLAALPALAPPPSVGTTWTDAALEKLVKGPLYQTVGPASVISTRLKYDCIHWGRELHRMAAMEARKKLVSVGAVAGEGGSSTAIRRFYPNWRPV